MTSRTWSRWTCSAILLVILLVGTNAKSDAASDPWQPSSLTPPGKPLTVKGPINSKVADLVHGLAPAHAIQWIRITSFGGDGESALSVALDIRKWRLPVVVDGVCASACASYVFLLAPKRIVLPNSLVIFHHTANSLVSMLRANEREQVPRMLRVAEEVEGLFQTANVDRGLLYQPQLAIKTLCYFIHPASNGENDILYASRFRGWIPTRDYMSNSGLDFVGYWPENPYEIEKVWRDVFPPSAQLTIVFGGPKTPPPLEKLRSALQNIPECSSNKVSSHIGPE
jgi:hypothetical protein